MMASIGFREQIDAAPRGIVAGPPILTPEAPQALTLAQVEGVRGSLSLETITSQVDSLAPYASKVFGRRKIAALVCSSCVVGMVVPGLYSIFSGLRLSLDAGDRDVHNRMQFAVLSVARQFRSVRIGICGAGFRGSLEAIYREQPVEQPKIERITALISSEEFRNSTALIIGGSRGLGELTAKLIAAGGGHVAITYAAGKNDADAVVAELKNAGLSCEARFYDVHCPAEEQVVELGMVPTHLYYFATPMIVRRKSGLLDQERFSELTHFYLAAFVEVVQACGRLNPKGLRVFYPSSNYVDMRPANMTEYAMAKAAGEVLCADLSRFIPGVRVLTRRLPQMLTDQTSSVLKLQSSDSIGIMLPIVREMHAGF
ncbi:MAG TPA: SDR family NAD(P)-dependent oxidoreductase [Steroidobacter sp.]|uniref:SDR family NAD(P)-dependent oxidoreductase n=1 Tax=Steroidobacter sp. TaxID=1978227 RepID=UPI002EDBAD7D